LNVRKAITADPVEKLNIDGEILDREAKIISEYQASGKITQENALVQNHLRMKENLAKRINLLDKKDERINALIERVVESPVISEERQDKLVEIFTERQERLGIRSEFLEEKTKIIEERKNTLDQAKEQRKEIVEQIRELPKNPDATREEVQAQRKELIEDLKDVKDASLEKLNQLREQGKEIIEKRKEEIQNMQKPATPIRDMQKAMEGVSNEVAQ
jgi:DNA repair exonuclease SbcCD ATPase subunit